MSNPARNGMTVKQLAELFAGYARDNPDAIVKFTSCESGGAWPHGVYSKTSMGVFTGEQAAIHNARLCGGGVDFRIALLSFSAIELDRAEPLRQYQCYVPPHKELAETIEAETGFGARKIYATRHGCEIFDCVAIYRPQTMKAKS